MCIYHHVEDGCCVYSFFPGVFTLLLGRALLMVPVQTHSFDAYSWDLLDDYLQREREGYLDKTSVPYHPSNPRKKRKKGKER